LQFIEDVSTPPVSDCSSDSKIIERRIKPTIHVYRLQHRLRTVLHVLWLKLLNLLLSHPSSDLCTGSRLTNALNINSSHSPITFSQPANLTTYTILSLFSLCTESAPYPLLPLLDHLYLPHYKSPASLSHMHHLTCGFSSLLHSVNLFLFTLLLVHLILHISPQHHHQVTNSYSSVKRVVFMIAFILILLSF